MKTVFTILALCLCSISLQSNVTLERVHHQTKEGTFIELHVPAAALQIHLDHGDHQSGGCEPPICG